MNKVSVYRVQDADGRGPWKPGFSDKWVEHRAEHDDLPPWFQEFGAAHEKALLGEHIGSGCVDLEQLRRWFTATEYGRLIALGYQCVRIDDARILAESKIQVLFARATPLRTNLTLVGLYATQEARP